jgi:Domain of unknown function (DUF4118)
MNRVTKGWHRTARNLRFGPPKPRPRGRPETSEPGERSRMPVPRVASAFVLAVVLPTLTAAALIPVRVDHGPTAAIVLVVPVVLVAVLGATAPAVVAAITAGIAYDVLLTSPYYRLTIDDPDDVVTMLTLVAVGLVVGLLNSRLVRTRSRDETRRDELHHLLTFAHSTTTHLEPGELVSRASEHLTALLELRDCQWQPGYRGGAAPTLTPTGDVVGYAPSLNPDRAMLPPDLELPAISGSAQLGRFILTPDPGHVTSIEERHTAATIAQMFAAAMVAEARR